jgi:putative ABC transport system permease protein
MRSLWDDIRFGFRMLGRRRGLTALAILTFALGVGMNTAIFSVVAGYFWAPLPYGDAKSLVSLAQTNPALGVGQSRISLLDRQDWGAARSLDSIVAFRPRTAALSGPGAPVSVETVAAGPELFDVLRAPAALGRTFNQAERVPGEHRVAVISDGLWRAQFGADPRAVGSDFRLEGRNYTLIGVMPPGFHFLYRQAQVFIPLDHPAESANRRDARNLRALARLAPGVSAQQAAQELAALSAHLEQQYPATNRGWRGDVRPLAHLFIPRNARTAISAMYLAVTFVLLIACVNIASLLLSRGTMRRRELAIRAALGAREGALARLLLTESALLGLAGGAAGIALAWIALPWLRQIAPAGLGHVENLVLDFRGLAYGVALSLGSGLLAGWIPALAMTRGELGRALHGSGRGATTAGHGTLTGLVVAEVGLSVVLLAASGLMVKSVAGQLTADPGFDRQGLMSAKVSLPEAVYPEPRQAADFFSRVLAEVRRDPRVMGAAVAQTLPLGGGDQWSKVLVESNRARDAQDGDLVGWMVVSDGYFETLGVPILSGRGFSPRDTPDSPPVVVVNQTMARQYWPGDLNPVGRRLKPGVGDDGQWATVVGVARDVRHLSALEPARPEVYVPHAQAPGRAMTLVARAGGGLPRILRQAVWRVDREQPLYEVESVESLLERATAGPRATAQVLGFLAIVALLLAATGIYGVIGYLTTQRSREIGVRLALGACRADVFRMVLHGGLARAAAGLLVGLPAAVAITPLLKSLLFGLEPHDPGTFAAVGALLLAVAVVASLGPALRAMRVDPVRILRED